MRCIGNHWILQLPPDKGNTFHFDLGQGTAEVISFLKHDLNPNFVVLPSNIQTSTVSQFPFASTNDCLVTEYWYEQGEEEKERLAGFYY